MASSKNDLMHAIEILREYLREDFIVEECRTSPEDGCPSCQAIVIDSHLNQLMELVAVKEE